MEQIEMRGHINPTFDYGGELTNDNIAISDHVDLEMTAFRRWLDIVSEAIVENSLDKLKQCHTPPWSLASQLDQLPIEAKLIPPLVEAILKGVTRLSLIRFFMNECSQRIPLPHVGSCSCQICEALESDTTLRNIYNRKTLVALTSPIYILNRAIDEDAIQFCLNLKQRLMDYRAKFRPMRDDDSGNKILSFIPITNVLFRPTVNSSDFELKYKTLPQTIDSVDDVIVKLLDHCYTDLEAISLLVVTNVDQEEFVSYTRLTRKNLRLYNFAKLDLIKSLSHHTSQSVLNRLWLHQWTTKEFADPSVLVNNPVFNGFCMPLGGAIFTILMIVNYFITIPLMFLVPHPAMTFFVKNPRSKYFLSIIGEIVFQALLYSFIFTSPLKPYQSLVERMCNGKYGYATSQYLGFSIILYLFILGKIMRVAIRLMNTAGRNLLHSGTDILWWLEQASYALLLAGFQLVFVWVSNTDTFITSLTTELRSCFCQEMMTRNAPFCNQISFTCQTFNLNLDIISYNETIASMIFLVPICSIIITSGCFINLLAFPGFMGHIHPWINTLARRTRAVIRLLAHFCVLVALITIVIGGFMLLVTDSMYDCKNPSLVSGLVFYPFNSALWKLLWSAFYASNDQDGFQNAVSSTDMVKKVYKFSNDMVMFFHLIFMILIPLVLFTVFTAMLVQIMRPQLREDFQDWVIVKSRIQLYHLCRGAELPLPYNLLHPLFSFLTYLIRKFLQRNNVEAAELGGISIAGPMDAFVRMNVPTYRETQTRCRYRILAQIMHEPGITDKAPINF